MAIKSQKQVEDSIVRRERNIHGHTYVTWMAYVGRDPATHRQIRFERNSREEVEQAVKCFYSTYRNGAPVSLAKELNPNELADIMLARSTLANAGVDRVSFTQIAQYYIAHASRINRINIMDALRKYIGQFSEIQTRQRATVKTRVGRFAEHFKHREVHDISPHEVRLYLDNRFRDAAPKTYNNVLTYIKSFFNWCKSPDVGYCADNPAERIRQKQECYTEPEFVTADVVRQVFDLLGDEPDIGKRWELVRFFALSFFNGVRADEIYRLRRRDVNVEEGWIRVAMPKGFQRGIAPRIAPMTPTARAWLLSTHYEDAATDEPLFDQSTRSQYPRKKLLEFARARKLADWSLPRNAGRHSFVTMHVALEGDPRRTEAICGTSKEMRVNSYMGLATKKQAEEYFAVLPQRTTL